MGTFATSIPSTSLRPSRSTQGKIPGMAEEASSALRSSPESSSARLPFVKSVATATNGTAMSSKDFAGSRLVSRSVSGWLS